MKYLFSIIQNKLTILIILIILVILILPFIYRWLIMVFHFMKPYQQRAQIDLWLRHQDAVVGSDSSEKSIREIARKQTLRKNKRNNMIRDAQWRSYLNLQSIRRQLRKTPARTISMIPASLWIFDNYNLLYREIKKLQGSGNLHELSRLPVIETGFTKGCPRIYIIARMIIAATNNRPQESMAISIINAYQLEKELRSQELWSFGSVMSLCLLEKIADEAVRMIQSIHIKIEADRIAENVAAEIRGGGKNISELLKKQIDRSKYKSDVFVAHFILRLRTISVGEAEVVNWLAEISGREHDEYLLMLSEMITKERQNEAVSESLISGLIMSLKEIGELNWEETFKKVSKVEAELNQDPAGIYSKMDANTTSQYRHVVEKLALRYKIPETAVASKVVGLAGMPHADASLQIPNHVGTYLLGNGFSLLVNYLSGRPEGMVKPRNQTIKLRGIIYFAGISVITAGLLFLILQIAGTVFAGFPLAAILFCILLVHLSIGVAIQVIQTIFTRAIHPAPRLSMDFSLGIPDSCRTFVVMPVIIGNVSSARLYAARLEKFYLANKQQNLYFAILGDLKDAPSKVLEGDEAIIQAATKAIEQLNAKYSSSYPRFSLFLRERQWNEKQHCWMCWERKRGKLEEFNALLCGEDHVGFEVRIGAPELFPTFQYVITLDADTDLIRESAGQLVGIMAHPLNQPVIDDKTCRIISGYAIVQSEICSRVSDAGASLFTRLFTGESGIDNYATVISDIYQDTFDEGIYVGKGIYDFRVMHYLLRGMIAKNTVLSHDLLESSLTRCGFASGIRMLDTTPPNIAAFTKRDHRWIRGDWQLLPWIFRKSRINWLSRWKMIDNLRRSLVPAVSVLTILINIVFFPDIAWLSIPFIIFTDAFRLFDLLFNTIYQKIKNTTNRIAFQILFAQIFTLLMQAAFNLILLPHHALNSLDAIFRTLYRLLISHRNLLEWQTSEAVEKNLPNSLGYYIRMMWPSVLPGTILVVSTFLLVSSPMAVLLYILALFWILSPVIAFVTSQPSRILLTEKILPDEALELRILARKTWRFFEDFATEDNNWLCPDNFQQFPGPRISDKTSPTNIGMQLLSALSACDFGFIGLRELVDHCEAVMLTLRRMTKWNGHLYNWYNVKTLDLLMPNYVSTVDSGNFLAHLITLKNGLHGLAQQSVFPDRILSGLKDTLAVAGLDPNMMAGSFVTKESRELLLDSIHKASQSADIKAYWRNRIEKAERRLSADMNNFQGPDGLDPRRSIKDLAETGNADALSLLDRIRSISMEIDTMVDTADFNMLYDARHHLFHIGYNVSNQHVDAGLYDLLASEARITSLLAIAKGDIPQKNWFALGRPLTLVRGIPALVSWSGTMFEYLMPNLIMKTPHGTLLKRSCTAAVNRQINHGKKQNIPWGISESQYFLFDNDSNYQYAAFGMQYLRLQSSMKPARVVAPYATALALCVKPKAALSNLRKLQRIGAEGEYGMYEALDFNRPDSTRMAQYSLVQSFMAHHQGMVLSSINNCLHANILQKRFHDEAMIRAASILLEETRSPVLVSLARRGYSINIEMEDYENESYESRYCTTINPKVPTAHVLSNNHYLLLLTSGGQGFSKCDDVMLNSWRPEVLGLPHGNFVYIRNLKTDQIWSNAYYPTFARPDEYQAIFSLDKVEYHRKDGAITTHTDITLSPIENLEIRRITLSNQSDLDAEIELTSYMEVVNDIHIAEATHPAFSKMFLELEYVPDRNLLIAGRRKRSEEDHFGLVMHMVRSDARFLRSVEFETDRRSFIGRGGTQSVPQALKTHLPLSNRSGFSLDPVMSLRAFVALPANRSVTVTFFTGYCPDRGAVLKLSHELRNASWTENAFKQSLTSSKLELKYLNINSQQMNSIQALVGPLYYPSRTFRDLDEIICRNRKGQSGLWRFGISGDYPIVLLRIKEMKDLPVVKDVLLAYEFLRLQMVRVDLVIINEEDVSYTQHLQQAIVELTGTMKFYNITQHKPSLFILRRFLMTDEESDLISTAARIIINSKVGIYALQFDEGAEKSKLLPQNIQLSEGDFTRITPDSGMSFIPPVALEFFNGIGGFTADGQEYEMWLGADRKTPAPWINVISNESFGFHVSETGSGYTWAGNSRENKLTNWSNDSVLDPASEAVFIKDQLTGAITSPASLRPGRGQGYQVRHGFGYSVFSHAEIDLEQSMTLFAAAADPVKLYLITIRDHSGHDRDLSVTLYAEWVLGAIKEQSAPFIVTRYDPGEQIFTARNVYSDLERQRPAFIFGSEPITSFTGERKAFLGIGRSINYPLGLASAKLSGEIGACHDPCGAIQMQLHLAAGASKTLVLGLGQAGSMSEATELAAKFRSVKTAKDELELIRSYWKNTLSHIRVKTPNRSLDLLINGWLPYQIISCRLRARSAFYQCGGAYGFRDQLQDVLSLLDIDPQFVEKQIHLCCEHQFVEGDVQHWWHPITEVGVRTRISDDLLWLPFAAAAYVGHTGKTDILFDQKHYIEGDILTPEESEKMFMPRRSMIEENIYQHCLRAIDRASRFGDNGLPLMGGGDWNDGMNRVGIKGKGESVWLGWFYYTVLMKFAPLCLLMKDPIRHEQLNTLAESVIKQIEKNAWDGRWYLRGFFDDGSPLGSRANEECQIDSISQSWAVLSGGADPIRAAAALDSAKHYLVHPADGVIQLLTPPFNKSMPDPGYIKGYYPGIRENGGQYTHAAIWLAMANSIAGRSADAYELLNMLNPIMTTSTVKDVARYEKEPYVMSADIYMGEPFTGKAGWSWYTGSAGWMYHCILHSFLGLSRKGDRLYMAPQIPPMSGEWQIDYHFGDALYKIQIENYSGQKIAGYSISIDGVPEKENSFLLMDDQAVHTVTVAIVPAQDQNG